MKAAKVVIGIVGVMALLVIYTSQGGILPISDDVAGKRITVHDSAGGGELTARMTGGNKDTGPTKAAPQPVKTAEDEEEYSFFAALVSALGL
ncbi:MAG: hypothetical protein AAF677_09515 [Pseudomonadota bacterium]